MLALVILVFFDVQDAATALPAALSRAAEQALGPGTKVVVRPIEGEPAVRDLLAAGRAQGASVVARLSWGDARRLHANLQLQVIADDRRAGEALTFEESDPLAERGRALGLVLAALLAPENKRILEERRQAAPEVQPRTEAPPSTVVSRVSAAPDAQPTTSRPHGSVLDASAEGGIALGGAGSGVGGTIGFGRRLGDRLAWRVGVRARFGEVAEAQASTLSAGLAGGLAATLVRATEREHFELALRLDALVLYEALSHFSSDDSARVSRGRALPGAALLGEVRFWVGPGAAMVLGAGPEVAFGRTDVLVHETKVAQIVPLRVSIHGGLQITF